MGCDIHLVVEKKNSSGNWEILKEEQKINRNYYLFSALANVRNAEKGEEGYVEPLSNPKGLPCDSPTIKFVRDSLTDFLDPYMWESYWDPDDTHSHSFNTLKELKEYKHRLDYFHSLENTIKTMQKISDECGGDENVRIVFCFDN